MLKLVKDDKTSIGNIGEDLEILAFNFALSEDGEEQNRLAFDIINHMNIVNYKRILAILKGRYKNDYLENFSDKRIANFIQSDNGIHGLKDELRTILTNIEDLSAEDIKRSKDDTCGQLDKLLNPKKKPGL